VLDLAFPPRVILRDVEKSALDNFISSLKTPELRSLANYFDRNLRRAENLRVKHMHLIFAEVMDQLHMRTATEVLKDGFKKQVLAGGKFTDEFHAEVVRRMSEAEGGHPEVALARGADERIEHLKRQDADFGNWLRALDHSSVVAMWSAFETLVSDVWIFAINSRPDLFAVRVLQGFNELLPEGMSGRCIPVGLAAKYNFDLRHCVGDIIGKRIDFTSLQDILKAYKTAFDLDEKGVALLRSADLKRLGRIRNLVVHRSGLIDVKFKKQTGCSEAIGDEFVLAEGDGSLFIQVVTDVGTHLVKTVDHCLTP
jgi:hypothetical protein